MPAPLAFSTWYTVALAVFAGEQLGLVQLPLTIQIDAIGTVCAKGHQPMMTSDQVKSFLQGEHRRMQKRAADWKVKGFEPRIVLELDAKLPFKDFTRLFDIVKSAGFRQPEVAIKSADQAGN